MRNALAAIVFALLLAGGSANAADSLAPPVLLPVGSLAPRFTAVAHDGSRVDLARLRGKRVVLYFYVMDDSPGCTTETVGFRDNWRMLSKRGVRVIGVATQSQISHRTFARKHKLPFPLLTDDHGEITTPYKVPVENGVARRVTYLIGRDGKVEHVWPQVNPTGHAAEILAVL